MSIGGDEDRRREELRGEALPALARAALEERLLGRTPAVPPAEPWLLEPAATFVTLKEGGELRGCIGSLEARRSLWEDLRANAVAAAFRDPRFPPLRPEELGELRIEVSLLSAPEPLPARTEGQALDAIRPGLDGLVLEAGPRRGTFLPQVWEQLPEAAEFLRHLKLKAGLPAEGWSPEWRLSRYTVRKWAESAHEEAP